MEIVLKGIFLAITKHFSHQYPFMERIIMGFGGVVIVYLVYQAGRKIFISSSTVSNINSLSQVDGSDHLPEKCLSNNLLANESSTKCIDTSSTETALQSPINKFCIYCGNQINTADEFCAKCGKKQKGK